MPITAAATVSASCYPTNQISRGYNHADITPAASSFCSSVLRNAPLSSAKPSEAWVPNNDNALLLRAALLNLNSCNGYADEDVCMQDMLAIMQQCPELGGTVNEPCVQFMYAVVSLS